MHFNIYLKDQQAKKLDHLAQKLGRTRNSLIREAVDLWLGKVGGLTWPDEIQNFEGVKDAPKFENYRHELNAPKEDIF